MRLIVYLAFLLGTQAHAAGLNYYNQPLHERILFGETAKGFYVLSFYNQEMDVVRFSNCLQSQCRPLSAQLKREDLTVLNREAVNRLEKVRLDFISYVKTNPLRTLISGSSDLEVLNQLIGQLKAEGLSNVILLRAGEKASLNFRSAKLYADVSEALSAALQNPILRQQVEPEMHVEAEANY